MKTKLFTLLALCFLFSTPVEAQFLKKLKKKAEQAAERTILRKTDEIVSKKTEKTIDDAASGEKKDNSEKNQNSSNDTINKTSSTSSSSGGSPVANPMMGSNKGRKGKLPETYTFTWEFKTKLQMVGKKKSQNGEYQMNYFINKNKDYYAIEYENEETKKMGGKVTMVLDFKSEAMVMFSKYGDQNMAMLSKLKNPSKKKIKDKDRNYTFKEIGTKTILGYECFGMEVENKNSLVKLWFTLEAPVNFSAFFAFSSEAAPKGFSDPELFDILKEEALLMEMDMKDKKRNQSMYMTAISLEEKKMEYHKKDYRFMSLGL
ncbi:DUF4412 domain-containing protein [uncultured Algibacter sp.]|uniref:DUF4412 domain-containing protein n=1 Tax=uncultured Algibacter sp. TaxID=298659 RepID=UPI002611FDE8|nr:DUF4412 domain-containing protein [uncultured Algibacter sp.]